MLNYCEGERLDDCRAPKVFSAQGRLPGPRACSQRWACPPRKNVPNTDDTGLHSQRCTGDVQEGAPGGGGSFHSGQLIVCGQVGHPHRRPFFFVCLFVYELSRASRTFMICCLMTFVASPAFGIKYLGGGKTRGHRSR